MRFIDAFIENLYLEKAALAKPTPFREGRPAYNPKDLIKLYIYGYFNSKHKLPVYVRTSEVVAKIGNYCLLLISNYFKNSIK